VSSAATEEGERRGVGFNGMATSSFANLIPRRVFDTPEGFDSSCVSVISCCISNFSADDA
jgi:hypothetical protein